MTRGGKRANPAHLARPVCGPSKNGPGRVGPSNKNGPIFTTCLIYDRLTGRAGLTRLVFFLIFLISFQIF